VLSLAAGADLLCLGPLPTEEDIRRIISEIVAAVLDGRLPLARLEAAAERVARLRTWFGTPHTGQAEENVIGLAAARRAISLTGSASPLINPLVVEVDTPPTIAVGDVPWGFTPLLPQAEVLRVKPEDADVPDILERAAGRSLILVVKDAHRYQVSRSVVSELLAARPDATVVEMGLPIWRPEGVTYLATYGAARANAQAAAELLGV
jgi:beta-N-acetylhexosaminidase